MPHYKPNHLLKGVLSDTGRQLPYRDQDVVDKIVGLKRKAVQIGTGFWDWPLWTAYPTWHMFNQMLADERTTAEKEGRPPHKAAAPPPLNKHQQHQIAMYGELVTARDAMGIRYKGRPKKPDDEKA